MVKRKIEDINAVESYRLSQAEFKGMVVQSLQDIKEDIAEIKGNNNITRWISFGIAGLSGIISSIIGRDISP